MGAAVESLNLRPFGQAPLTTALALAIVLVTAAPASPASAGPAEAAIATVAGGGVGDGRGPLDTHLTSLLSVDVDARGGVWWTESRSVVGGSRARVYDPGTGVVRSVAGNGLERGTPTRLGETGPAADAVLWDAAGIAADPGGKHLYIFDTGNWRVRHVDVAAGTVRTIHNPDFVFAEVGTPIQVDQHGRVWFVDQFRIMRWDPATERAERVVGGGDYPLDADGVRATDVRIGAPEDFEVDAGGNVYLIEAGVFPGDGSSQYNGPRIRWVDPQGFIHTLAGGFHARTDEDGAYGSVTRLDKSVRHRILAQSDGSVWYTDAGRVRRIDPRQDLWLVPGSRRVTTLFTINGGFADGPLTSAGIGAISDWAAHPDGGVVFADGPNRRIRLLDDGVVATVVGNGLSATANDPGPDIFDFAGDGLAATDALLSVPCATAVGPDGDLYVAETRLQSQYIGQLGFHARVRRVDAGSGRISTLAGTTAAGFSGDGGPAAEAELNDPCGVVAAPDGSVYIADTANNRIRRVDADGVIRTVAGTGVPGSGGDGGPALQAALHEPTGLALAPDGDLLVAEQAGNRIRRLDAQTQTITTVAGTGGPGYSGDGGPAVNARLSSPRAVALRPDGTLLIADTMNNRVRAVASDGRITTVAGTGASGFGGDGGPAAQAQLAAPTGVAVDPATGIVHVADGLNQRIRSIDGAGVIRTLAGTGALDLCGDGGPPAQACFRNPRGLSVHGGRLFLADLTNLRVRAIDLGP